MSKDEAQEFLITLPWKAAAALETLAPAVELEGGWAVLEELAWALELGVRIPGSPERAWLLASPLAIDPDQLPAEELEPEELYGPREEVLAALQGEGEYAPPVDLGEGWSPDPTTGLCRRCQRAATAHVGRRCP